MVITGIGLLLPGAASFSELRSAMEDGKRLTGTVETPELHGIKGLGFTNSLTKKALFAMYQAMEDSGISDSENTGVFLGSAFGSLKTMADFERMIAEDRRRSAMPMDFMNTVMNAAAGQLAIFGGLSGMNMTLSSGSRSAYDAMEYASDMLAAGRINAAIAGGIEEMHELYEAFIRKNGAVPSDGVCLFVTERREDAIRRGAHIYAEVLSMAAEYMPDGADTSAVRERAVREAGIDLDRIDLEVTNTGGNAARILKMKDITDEIYSASFAAAAAAAIAAGKNGDIAMVTSVGFDGFAGCAVIKIY